MTEALPRISCCIKTYNEERNINDCLSSIFNQNYPKDKLEVILVDDKSTDNTVEIAREFPVKILFSGKRDPDLSMMMGFKEASGMYFITIDPDMQFRGKDWFIKMVKPLIENPNMAAAITKYYSHPKESLVTKYLSLDPFQRDLIYQLFSTNIEGVITEKRDGYYICEYTEDKIPPQSHGLYRVSVMRKIINQQKIWYDMGNLVLLVKEGYTKFAYIPDAGFYHLHADSLSQLVSKRIRNVEKSYLRYLDKSSHFRWFSLNSTKDIVKIILLIISANLFFPIFLISLYKVVKYKNWLYILEAPITFLLVDSILFAFLKDYRGRKFILDNLIKILKK